MRPMSKKERDALFIAVAEGKMSAQEAVDWLKEREGN